MNYCRTSNNSLHQIFMFFVRKNKFSNITSRENRWRSAKIELIASMVVEKDMILDLHL